MIDYKIITESIKKLLDIIYSQGYIYGKLELDFDKRTGKIKIQIHRFDKENEESIRRTSTIVNQMR